MGLTASWKILVRPIGWSIGSAAVLVAGVYLIGRLFGATMEVTLADETRMLTVWDLVLFAAAAVGIGGLVAVTG